MLVDRRPFGGSEALITGMKAACEWLFQNGTYSDVYGSVCGGLYRFAARRQLG